jgi:Sucrase/ferredoxin-like
MAGTALSARRWLCLERPEPWPRDVTQHPDPAVRALLARAAVAGFRPVLIRGGKPDPGLPVRLLLVDTAPHAAVATWVTVDGPERLGEVPLRGPDASLPGEPMTGPLLLVCTHAERDPCCGLDGAALVEKLARPEVFACSHLGGHRFAPTALLLPTGYCYGRLTHASAASVLARAYAGYMTTDRCRGRCTWSPAGQVAELAVRATTGLREPDDVVVLDDEGGPIRVEAATGQRFAVVVEAADAEVAQPSSCGVRPALTTSLRATSVRPLGRGAGRR